MGFWQQVGHKTALFGIVVLFFNFFFFLHQMRGTRGGARVGAGDPQAVLCESCPTLRVGNHWESLSLSVGNHWEFVSLSVGNHWESVGD